MGCYKISGPKLQKNVSEQNMVKTDKTVKTFKIVKLVAIRHIMQAKNTLNESSNTHLTEEKNYTLFSHVNATIFTYIPNNTLT